MNGSEFVFDTNIFLYLQSGRKDLIDIFNESSFITELELLGYKNLSESADKDFEKVEQLMLYLYQPEQSI